MRLEGPKSGTKRFQNKGPGLRLSHRFKPEQITADGTVNRMPPCLQPCMKYQKCIVLHPANSNCLGILLGQPHSPSRQQFVEMDQAQTKALAALQPFVHLATTTKNPSHRFLADLITRATSAPGSYIFTELLQLPSIQSLRASDTPADSQAHLTLLEIFSWGTYDEYKSTNPRLHGSTPSDICRHSQPTLPQ